MAAPLDYTVAFDAPAEKIYLELASHQYWEMLMDAYRELTPMAEVRRFRADGAGVDVLLRHKVPRMHLPPFAQSVIQGDVVITRVQHIGPFDHESGSAAGSYGASVPHGPGRVTGHTVLTDVGTGSELRVSSRCRVNIPIFGGKLEQLILRNIGLLFDAEGAFVANRICQHH
jgi:hypothetical protein